MGIKLLISLLCHQLSNYEDKPKPYKISHQGIDITAKNRFGKQKLGHLATYTRFCLRILMALALTASCAGPGLVFLIFSLYLLSSASSFLIFSSTVSPLLVIWNRKHSLANR